MSTTQTQDGEFLSVLATCSNACRDMDLSDDNWKPLDGSYDVSIDSVQSGTKENNGVNNVWIKPVFTVLDGEFAGRTFTDYFYITPGASEPTMALRGLARLATCIAGREVRDPIECVSIIDQAAGNEFLSVEVFRTTSKKNGKTYANVRFVSRIDSTEAETEVHTDVAGTPVAGIGG